MPGYTATIALHLKDFDVMSCLVIRDFYCQEKLSISLYPVSTSMLDLPAIKSDPKSSMCVGTDRCFLTDAI